MLTVSIVTFYEGARLCLLKNPLPPPTDPTAIQKYLVKFTSRDCSALPSVYIEFYCYPSYPLDSSQSKPKCSIRGRSRLYFGFSGWYCGTEGSETQFQVDCVCGLSPVEAIEELIKMVESFE
jgi:hypothetical protein